MKLLSEANKKRNYLFNSEDVWDQKLFVEIIDSGQVEILCGQGYVCILKTDSGFDITLRQFRTVVESFENQPLERTIEIVKGWLNYGKSGSKG